MRLCYLALDRLDLQFPSKETGALDASTDSWKPGGARQRRQILDWAWTIFQEFVRQIEEPSHVVVFTDSEQAGCLKTRAYTSSSKWFYSSHMLRFTSTTQGVIELSSGESEFLRSGEKGVGRDLEQSQCSKIWELISAKNTKIDKAVLEVRVDASAGRGMAARRGTGRIRHIATQTLWVQKLTQVGIVKITKISLVSNTADLEPNTLTEDQIDEHWRDVTATFVKEGLESRCEQKRKESRNSILKFSLLTMHAKLTRSRK